MYLCKHVLFLEFSVWCNRVLYSSVLFNLHTALFSVGWLQTISCSVGENAYQTEEYRSCIFDFQNGYHVLAQGTVWQYEEELLSRSSFAVSVPLKWMSKSEGRHKLLQAPNLFFQPWLSALSQRKLVWRWCSLKSLCNALEDFELLS